MNFDLPFDFRWTCKKKKNDRKTNEKLIRKSIKNYRFFIYPIFEIKKSIDRLVQNILQFFSPSPKFKESGHQKKEKMTTAKNFPETIVRVRHYGENLHLLFERN